MSTDLNTTNNLLFLLAAAPLGLGCIIVSDDTGETTVGGTSNPTTGTPTSGDTAGTDTNVATEGGTGGSGGATDGSTGVADSTGSVDSTGGTVGACAAYGELAIECYGKEYGGSTEYYCGQSLDYYTGYSAECGAAYEDYIVCLSGLSCEELEAPERCPDELAAFLAACPTAE